MAKKTTKKSKRKNPSKGVTVDIVSDIVCPWCWLGARYFQIAVKQASVPVAVTWRPYMLDPSVPESGLPYRDYMRAKFGDGPSDQFKAMKKHLLEAAPEVGITFRFDDIPYRPNTLDAHRLIRWANGQGLGEEASQHLFQAYFDDLKDVGDPGVLSTIAADIGMDKALVADLLGGDDDKDKVNEEIDFFRSLGVSGVPCFIYNGQFAVQGAQPVQTHLAAIDKAASLPTDT